MTKCFVINIQNITPEILKQIEANPRKIVIGCPICGETLQECDNDDGMSEHYGMQKSTDVDCYWCSRCGEAYLKEELE